MKYAFGSAQSQVEFLWWTFDVCFFLSPQDFGVKVSETFLALSNLQRLLVPVYKRSYMYKKYFWERAKRSRVHMVDFEMFCPSPQNFGVRTMKNPST